MYCIETRDLTFKFRGDSPSVNKVNLQVPAGSIYGFIGPNGAGKTTTLKLILGLLKAQTGAVHIFGEAFDAHRIEILKEIGSFIETPSFYPHLTAAENLDVLQKVYRFPKSRIKETLELVGLADTARKKVGQFSLGMKQRLSIAIAIIHNPKLLILDEPTNGLDPNGIIDIRLLLKNVNSLHGTTILVSSHLLSELEKLITHAGIIHNGNLLFQGELSELNTMQQQALDVTFHTSNPEMVSRIFSSRNLVPVIENGHVIIPPVDKELISTLNAELVTNQIKVYQIVTRKSDLESSFMNLINN